VRRAPVSSRAGLAEFRLQFPASEIESLAGRFSYEDDPAVVAAGRSARHRGHYSRDEFLTVCEWKTSRSRLKVASNSAKRIAKTTRAAFATADEGERMERLLSLEGVGVPTASTLLHFAFPDAYPLLDVRALQSLGSRGRSVYPVSFWLDYLAACRSLAAEHGVSLRILDRALWQHSKELASGESA
jgi:hypothetical protein